MRRIRGLSAIIFLVIFAGVLFLENLRSDLGYQDADNPMVMMEYLSSYSWQYILGGWGRVAISLTTFTMIFFDDRTPQQNTVLRRISWLFGLVAILFLLLDGFLRIQSPGTLLHMYGLHEDWGQSGYISLQIISNSVGPLAGFALFGWIITHSVYELRNNGLPRLLSILGIISPLIFLAAILTWYLWILAFIVVFIWFFWFGIYHLFRNPENT